MESFQVRRQARMVQAPPGHIVSDIRIHKSDQPNANQRSNSLLSELAIVDRRFQEAALDCNPERWHDISNDRLRSY
jgi:hypothetical protein